MKELKIAFFLVLIIILASCRRNNYSVNINEIDLELSIVRLEKELFESDPASLPDNLEDLRTNHQEFLRIFGYVINIGDISDQTWIDNMIGFITDRQNVEVFNETRSLFPDMDIIESDLTSAWKHYKYYFPEAIIPNVYTCVSGFNNSIIVGNGVVGIGIDRYLGADNRFYPMLGIYNYLARKMVPEKIVSDCMYGWASSSWELEENKEGGNTLLQTILHEGKLLYFTRSMLPLESDSLIFGFTEMQMRFCANNEQQMWQYLVEHDLLFVTDPLIIQKFAEEAPFTSFFSTESPGRAANWIGFRIIESFMRRNPDINLEGLMDENDFRSILERSKYSPG